MVKVPDPPNWEKWLDKIEKNTREHGWIWVHTAGYPFYYASNPSMYSSYTIGVAGLKRFLNRDVELISKAGILAGKIHSFAEKRWVFTSGKVYLSTDNIENVKVGEIFPAGQDFPYQILAYGTGDGIAVAALIMNRTNPGNRLTYPGSYIHVGVVADASIYSNYDHDWLKGYLGTVIALEMRKAIIQESITASTTVYHNDLTGFFYVMAVPGDYKVDYDQSGNIIGEIGLVLAMRVHYEDEMVQQLSISGIITYIYDLSVADFYISSPDSNVKIYIDLDSIGVDMGDKNSEIMNELNWWILASIAGSIPLYGPIIGSSIALIPIVSKYNGEKSISDGNNNSYVKDLVYDPDGDNWGIVSIYVKIRRKKIGSEAQATFTCNIEMFSWVSKTIVGNWPVYISKYINISGHFNFQITVDYSML